MRHWLSYQKQRLKAWLRPPLVGLKNIALTIIVFGYFVSFFFSMLYDFIADRDEPPEEPF